MSASSGFIGRSDRQRYITETYLLNASVSGVALAGHSAYLSIAAKAPVIGNTVTVQPGYRSMIAFFKPDTAGGSQMSVDHVVYKADMGGSRADPVISKSIADENSQWIDSPVITALNGAVVEVQVQREV